MTKVWEGTSFFFTFIPGRPLLVIISIVLSEVLNKLLKKIIIKKIQNTDASLFYRQTTFRSFKLTNYKKWCCPHNIDVRYTDVAHETK